MKRRCEARTARHARRRWAGSVTKSITSAYRFQHTLTAEPTWITGVRRSFTLEVRGGQPMYHDEALVEPEGRASSCGTPTVSPFMTRFARDLLLLIVPLVTLPGVDLAEQNPTADPPLPGTVPHECARLMLEPGAPPPPVEPATIARNDAAGATIRAVRIDDLHVDGTLDEMVYRTVQPFSDFIQLEPTAGAPASERTEAWVLFDDTSLYLSVRAWNQAPESEWVANEMRRDSLRIGQNENIGILLDTFYDRRNGILFNVTPIGGRIDGQVTNESNVNLDWNPIWTVRTGRFAGGWSVEMGIPFKSMRCRPGPS